MTPVARNPLSNFEIGIFNEIKEAWGLDNILHALPGTLNPHRTKNATSWGMDFILDIQKLAHITKGRHADVVRALQIRVGQRTSPIRPSAAQCTIVEDIKHLLMVNEPRPTGMAPMVNRSATRAGTQRAGTQQASANHASTRVSERLRKRNHKQSSMVINQDSDQDEDIDAPPEKDVGASSQRVEKRKRDLRDEGNDGLQGSDRPRKRADIRSRSRSRQQNLEEDAVNEHQSVAQDQGQPNAGGKGVQQSDNQNDQQFQVCQEQRVQIQDDEDAYVSRYAIFEEHYPLPTNATPGQRINMLRALQKRNRDLRAAGPHFRDSVDSEYDYRILREEAKDEYHRSDSEEVDDR